MVVHGVSFTKQLAGHLSAVGNLKYEGICAGYYVIIGIFRICKC